MTLLQRLKHHARRLKAETLALYLAARDPRTPWPVRLFLIGVAAYALSPIDLIPDFIPVLGYLDELILLPLALALAIRLLPPEVLADCRARADARLAEARRAGRVAAVVIVALWLACAVVLWLTVRSLLAAGPA